MRASFILLGPLLARFGRVIISNPGGDRIGRRPVNLHVDAMRALGAEIDYRNGYYFAQAPGRLRGGEVTLPAGDRDGHRERDARGDARRRPHGHPAGGPGARGRRPHRLPAQDGRRGRRGPSPDTIEVDGKRRLRGASHTVIPDRIETGTFLVAAAVTGGRITLENAPCEHVEALRRAVRPSRACRWPAGSARSRSTRPVSAPATCGRATSRRRRTRASRRTSSRPTCVLLTQANGTSRVHEAIFEDRLEWLAELRKLGARVEIEDAHHAAILGPATAPRRRGGHRRPARRRVADPRRAGRRGHLARSTARITFSGGMRTSTASSSSWVRASPVRPTWPDIARDGSPAVARPPTRSTPVGRPSGRTRHPE